MRRHLVDTQIEWGFETVLFDLDGTLVDSNSAHADAWAQALREHGVRTDADSLRPYIGMGGDKLLPAVAGIDETSARGQTIAKRKKALFADGLSSLQATPGARSLIQFLREVPIELVIATSADDREVTALLEQADVADLLPIRASKDDASESKPDPDIVHAALKRAAARPETALLIGDTPYDIEAAERAGISCLALRCGGYWTDADLRGAVAIYDHPAALLAHLCRGR